MIVARIHITLKQGILDPKGKTVKHALENLGFDAFADVRVGKFVELKCPDLSPDEVRTHVENACEKLLANPVIEDYHIELIENHHHEA